MVLTDATGGIDIGQTMMSLLSIKALCHRVKVAETTRHHTQNGVWWKNTANMINCTVDKRIKHYNAILYLEFSLFSFLLFGN